ncbi:UDP-N-acetylmuramyl pentapeptide phosphotransferase/UDP-N-acetylglucosamine-1-phosphate transferase [Anseongella ginsenosidimutans]|uniref:UDP-N-acetylmuramyl pentapeptide phosphotransferase/UDP-N-acetylglucosamine-1-phosphate transferase n=1 Tax=Anseongella ginsenosidimutans TaxID=496056 RepID=A0A4V2UT90_9SPHI|nr:glycosyltransferase family 4 protein [Anseongella ginsenosidimutans]QEC52147.1 glycosyltransferase family 4 protein [Anseongella ginsenosidimutans]TCS84824.1 UDP-N-acetylmuramyl pentapeptide phosphotransferase/UDP-N-acetylglucosamine-1-phosphate transferase [Anseongella ginsenosidimutans]
MYYLIVLAILLLLERIYFRIADRYNIIDKPNERSSHDRIVIRGGGIIVPLAALIWWVLSGWHYPFLMGGLLLVSLISFLDDIYTLSNKIRLLVQFTAAALVLYETGLGIYSWLLWIPLLVVIVGFKNAFNFMDGINGITALYSLSAIAGFFYVNTISQFTDETLLIYIALAVLVFAYFNLRKKARCFAGDVGAVALAFLLAFWMIQLVLDTGEGLYILFFAVYGVDAVLTIFHRLLKKENIFQAHRSHLYQYMANERRMGHVPVSLLYFVLQAAINLLVIFWLQLVGGTNWPLFIAILLVLSAIYVAAKFSILRKLKSQTT